MIDLDKELIAAVAANTELGESLKERSQNEFDFSMIQSCIDDANEMIVIARGFIE